MPHDAAFNTTYPAVGDAPNFDSFAKAKYACKTWAIDSNKPMFAISKSQSSIESTKASVYQCHVGTKDKADYPIYTKPTLAYDLVDGTSTTSPSATHGGLFSNGLIGLSVDQVSSLNSLQISLLLPADIIVLLPPSTTSIIDSIGFEPKSALTAFSAVQPRLAPIRP
jgi:hypothetical protein